jgi:hypothetical protein
MVLLDAVSLMEKLKDFLHDFDINLFKDVFKEKLRSCRQKFK